MKTIEQSHHPAEEHPPRLVEGLGERAEAAVRDDEDHDGDRRRQGGREGSAPSTLMRSPSRDMSATWIEPARPAATASPVASAFPDTAETLVLASADSTRSRRSPKPPDGQRPTCAEVRRQLARVGRQPLSGPEALRSPARSPRTRSRARPRRRSAPGAGGEAPGRCDAGRVASSTESSPRAEGVVGSDAEAAQGGEQRADGVSRHLGGDPEDGLTDRRARLLERLHEDERHQPLHVAGGRHRAAP